MLKRLMLIVGPCLLGLIPSGVWASGYYGGYSYGYRSYPSYGYSYPSYSYPSYSYPSYANYQYSPYAVYGYDYYYGGYHGTPYYWPAGWYRYAPTQVNIAKFVPYIDQYYTPYSTYQPPAAVPLVPLSAVATVQQSVVQRTVAADPHDCKAETKVLRERLELLERSILLRQTTQPAGGVSVPSPTANPPAGSSQPPPQAVAPPAQQQPPPRQQVKLDGRFVFQTRCLKCHAKDKCSESVLREGKEVFVQGVKQTKGGGHDLEDMGPVKLVKSYKQLAKDAMPLDGPLTQDEAPALLAYFDSLDVEKVLPRAKQEAVPVPKK